MFSIFIRRLILLPFEIFGKVVQTILFSPNSSTKRRRKTHERMWIDQVMELRRRIREQEYRHRQETQELENRYQEKLRHLQRQQSSKL
jgi:hypothetical protein